MRDVRAHRYPGTLEVMVADDDDPCFSEVATLVVVLSDANIALAVGSVAAGT